MFPFLQLPVELQRYVLKEYFGPWTVNIIEEESFTNGLGSRPVCHSLPSRALLLVNRHIYREAKPILWDLFDGTMSFAELLPCRNIFYDAKLEKRLGILRPKIHTLTLGMPRQIPQLKVGRLRKLRVLDIGAVRDSDETEGLGFYGANFPLANALDGSNNAFLEAHAEVIINAALRANSWHYMCLVQEIIVKGFLDFDAEKRWGDRALAAVRLHFYFELHIGDEVSLGPWRFHFPDKQETPERVKQIQDILPDSIDVAEHQNAVLSIVR